MARTRKTSVNKVYDGDEINGWKIGYEYDSENGAPPKDISVTAEKDGKVATINLKSGNTFVNWNDVPADKDVLISVLTEFDVIMAEYNNAVSE